MRAVLDMWNGAPTGGLAELLSPTYRGQVLGAANGERDAAADPGSIARYRSAFPGVAFSVVDDAALLCEEWAIWSPWPTSER